MASLPCHCCHVYCSCGYCCCGHHHHGYCHCGVTAVGHCHCGCNLHGNRCHGHCCWGIATVSEATRSVTTAVASLPWTLPPLAWPLQALLLWASPPWHHCHGYCYCGHCHFGHHCCVRHHCGVISMCNAIVGITAMALQLWHCHCRLCCCGRHCLGITAVAHGHCCHGILTTDGYRALQGLGHCWWLRATMSPPS